ncbi:hypothetical protein Vqi01_54600 [Micromonospora qiuiae]|uniref:HK97 gp10 family phage protein n=1 Tax=Micromonospora qiuiae TaxID=502268 RepID=A0ABQ4JI63_9ACTN|nr:hypothetical protein [Micromonospora qiuiae]GIJ30298.1 hypothetical protein Vqi01_54600 [Micromonospora qiuiae]
MLFDLTPLGPKEFEELSQALAVAVLGGAVSVFGEGRDDGREATFEGRMQYPNPLPPTEARDGYGILQAKYHTINVQRRGTSKGQRVSRPNLGTNGAILIVITRSDGRSSLRRAPSAAEE